MHIEEDYSGFAIKFESEDEFYDYEDGALSLLPDSEMELSTGERVRLLEVWEKINAAWELELSLSYIPKYTKVTTKGWKGDKDELYKAMGRILEGY